MTESGATGVDAPVARPDMYLIISNIAKKMNLGMMIRSACAFGAKCVMVVGGSQRFATFGAHGTTKYVSTMWFPKLKDCVTYLKERGGL
jgi:tRNA G18 (ribose-2'-O)-methylase SpoU